MRISIFGIGYVGVVSAACLVRDGHTVTCVDPVRSKVDEINKGRTPIQEPGVAALLKAGHDAGLLSATTDPAQGVGAADVIWVCVGTPSSAGTGIDLTYVETVMSDIGREMKRSDNRPLVVIRSTVLPGNTNDVLIPAIQNASGLTVGKDFDVVFHPEFLREATAVADFDNPPKIVIGESSSGAGDRLRDLYESYHVQKFTLSLAEAEMVKYSDNLFHALKITFANEIAAIAHSAGVDSRRVADVFLSDTKLNISTRYLKPGFAFGGSCLPKDLRAILSYADSHDVPTPMLRGILESNALQIDEFVDRVRSLTPTTVGMVGIAFKPDTDDMRESPFVEVAKRLASFGIKLKIYDPSVHVSHLLGTNKTMVEAALGELRKLLVDSVHDLDDSEVILVNHSTVTHQQIHKWSAAGSRVIDLVDVPNVGKSVQNYEGISW